MNFKEQITESKYKVKDKFSQDWADFKNGSKSSFDIYEVTFVDGDTYKLKSATHGSVITADIGDFWKYHLVYIDKRKKSNILKYQDEINNKKEVLDDVLLGVL